MQHQSQNTLVKVNETLVEQEQDVITTELDEFNSPLEIPQFRNIKTLEIPKRKSASIGNISPHQLEAVKKMTALNQSTNFGHTIHGHGRSIAQTRKSDFNDSKKSPSQLSGSRSSISNSTRMSLPNPFEKQFPQLKSLPTRRTILNESILSRKTSTGSSISSNYFRNESYLYRVNPDDENKDFVPSRTDSITSEVSDSSNLSEALITPFGQMLASLENIRYNLERTLCPERVGLDFNKNNNNSFHKRSSTNYTSIDENKELSNHLTLPNSLITAQLDEFDRVLHQLKSINPLESMSKLAAREFAQKLRRESILNNASPIQRWTNWLSNRTSTADYSNSKPEKQEKIWMEKFKSLKQPIETSTINNAEIEQLFKGEALKWEFDIFHLDKISKGHCLLSTAYGIFKNRNFFKEFHLDESTCINFFGLVEVNYIASNAYHNHIHGADVMMNMNNLLRTASLHNNFTPLQLFSCLVAAATHDVGHFGRNNTFAIESGHCLAFVYNDISVLENYHASLTFFILRQPGCDILAQFNGDERRQFRNTVIKLILATDMRNHMELLGDVKTLQEAYTTSSLIQTGQPDHQLKLFQMMIHCADVAAPSKPWPIMSAWSDRVYEEFFDQGDEERANGRDISFMCDRRTTDKLHSQYQFIDLCVLPLYQLWTELVAPEGIDLLETMLANKERISKEIIERKAEPLVEIDPENDTELEKDKNDANEDS